MIFQAVNEDAENQLLKVHNDPPEPEKTNASSKAAEWIRVKTRKMSVQTFSMKDMILIWKHRVMAFQMPSCARTT